MTPLLTVGMATFDDHEGLWPTVKSLLLHHSEIARQLEVVVVDNNPSGSHAKYNRDLLVSIRPQFAGTKYVSLPHPVGSSCAKNRVFEAASAPVVLCIDSHVLLEPLALTRLLDWFNAHPGSKDLVTGPIVYNDGVTFDSHLDDVWSGQAWGTWGKEEQDGNPFSPPREIPAMGCGLIAMRREAWPKFNPKFRGFGSEEYYIHEKVRRQGGKCWCLPFLRWHHRFDKPSGTKYPLSVWNKVRNYVIGHAELGLSLDRIYDHFVTDLKVMPQQEWDILTKDPLDPPESISGMLVCTCGLQDKPALEHQHGCPVRVGFHGGDPSWDKSKSPQRGRDGHIYAWDEQMGVWDVIYATTITSPGQPRTLITQTATPSPLKPGPGLIRMAINASKALGRVAIEMAKGNPVIADEATVKERLAICETCECRDGDRCNHMACGCQLLDGKAGTPGKLMLRTEECPIKKWGRIAPS